MSYPYFIRLPRYYDKNLNFLHIYHNEYVHPRRVDRFMITREWWLNYNNLPETIENCQIYHKTMNCNSVRNLLDKYIEDKFHATPINIYGKNHQVFNLYINLQTNKLFFYTLNLYKHHKAIQDFENDKAFFINIYSIDDEILKVLEYYDDYNFKLIQLPKGFKYTLNKNYELKRRNNTFKL